MYEITKKENSEVFLDVTIPWSDVVKDFDAKIEAAGSNINVKGFRKGKVPKDVAASQVDRMAILGDVANTQIGKVFEEAVKKEDLHVIAQPHVTVKKLAEGNDVTCDILVAVMPEMVWPKDWKKKVAAVNVAQAEKAAEVSNADVDEEIAKLAESRGEEKSVDRAAGDGDVAIIDFTVLQDKVVIDGGTSTDHPLVLGSNSFIPGFEEKVIGMKKGDEGSFDLAFPKEYHAEHLAGKDAVFKVTVKDVKERIVPKIDDAFAKTVGEFDTLEALKKDVKDNLSTERTARAQEENQSAQLEVLMEMFNVELPQSVIDMETQRMFSEMNQQLTMTGMTMEGYLQSMGKDAEALAVEWKPQANKRVLSAIILEKLAVELDITPDKDKVEADMQKTITQYQTMGDGEKDIDTAQLYQYVSGQVRNEAIFETLSKL